MSTHLNCALSNLPVILPYVKYPPSTHQLTMKTSCNACWKKRKAQFWALSFYYIVLGKCLPLPFLIIECPITSNGLKSSFRSYSYSVPAESSTHKHQHCVLDWHQLWRCVSTPNCDRPFPKGNLWSCNRSHYNLVSVTEPRTLHSLYVVSYRYTEHGNAKPQSKQKCVVG